MSSSLLSQLVTARPHKAQLGVLMEPQFFILQFGFVRMEQEDQSASWYQQSACNIQQQIVQLNEVEMLFLGEVRVVLCTCSFRFLGLILL